MADDQTTRITYPLSEDDIKELEDLESKLTDFAKTAESSKKVALHSCYHQILKYSSMSIARAKMRSTRESNAERTRRHKTLKATVKQEVLAGAGTGANGAASAARPAATP